VVAVRFVAEWRLLLALCYDNCLRGYDTDTGDCKFVQANENRCMFSALEVDNKNEEVGASLCRPMRADACLALWRWITRMRRWVGTNAALTWYFLVAAYLL